MIRLIIRETTGMEMQWILLQKVYKKANNKNTYLINKYKKYYLKGALKYIAPIKLFWNCWLKRRGFECVDNL